MLGTIIAILIVAAIGVLIVAAAKDSRFVVKRAIEIDAPTDKVFAQINDFRRWSAWSPWEKMDPDMTRSFSGAASGEGAIYDWEGNGKVGKGRMTIQRVEAPSRVVIKLEFLKPMAAINETEFNLVQHQQGGTHATWTMEGRAPFMQRLMSLFMNMEKIVGAQFHEGLINLKRVSEA